MSPLSRLLPLVTLLTLAATTSPALAEPVVIERDALDDLIRQAEDSARRIDKELARIPKTAQPKAARDALEDLRGRLKALRATVQKARPAAPVGPAPAETRPCLASVTGQPVPAEALEALLGRISSASFNQDKLSALTAATAEQLFTVAQAVRLIGAFPFSNDKLSALRLLVPRLTDLTLQGRQDLLLPFVLSGIRQDAEAVFTQCQ